MKHSYTPEVDGERKDIDEGVNLKDTKKEHSEMLKRLQEEVPEEAQVRSVVWYRKTGREGKKW